MAIHHALPGLKKAPKKKAAKKKPSGRKKK